MPAKATGACPDCNQYYTGDGDVVNHLVTDHGFTVSQADAAIADRDARAFPMPGESSTDLPSGGLAPNRGD